MKLRCAHFTIITTCCLYFTVGNSYGQSIKLMRYDEDYSNLKDSIRNFRNSLKFIPISSKKKSYLTVGGELRLESSCKLNEDWIKDQGYNASILQRYSLYADVHLGTRFRLFAQLNTALENGSKYGPSPVDEDELAVQNLFVEYQLSLTPLDKLAFRIGRQEINYGSGRLVSVREGTTARQYFTGAKLMYARPNVSIDAFLLAADEVNFGVFDNHLKAQPNLWGAYSNLMLQRAGNFDIYYLGIKRDNAEFEEGTGKEVRHTLATRYWKSGGGFNYNLEGAYQFGKFNQGNIDAWTVAIEFGYNFDNLKFKPTLSIRNDYISGDKKSGDGKLQTFNPLYPKGGYFGFNPLIGPSNLIDLHPYLTLLITNKLILQADVVFNWRFSVEDGLYRPSGNFNTAGSDSKHRFIGETYLLSADFQLNNNLSFSAGGQYFRVGKFIEDIVPLWDNSSFLNVQATFKF